MVKTNARIINRLLLLLVFVGMDVKRQRIRFEVAKVRKCERCLDYHPPDGVDKVCTVRCLKCLSTEHILKECKEEVVVVKGFLLGVGKYQI